MNQATLTEAIAEAERFLKAAKALEALPENKRWYDRKLSGSCRRASMDLTRKLADLRNNR